MCRCHCNCSRLSVAARAHARLGRPMLCAQAATLLLGNPLLGKALLSIREEGAVGVEADAALRSDMTKSGIASRQGGVNEKREKA